MANYKARKGTEAFKLLSFALLTIYFVGIALFDGPVWCVDTNSYIDMDFSREPLYPLFVQAGTGYNDFLICSHDVFFKRFFDFFTAENASFGVRF